MIDPEQVSSIVEVTSEGLITFNYSDIDPALVDTTHELEFEAFLSDVDPDGDQAKALALTLVLEILAPIPEVVTEEVATEVVTDEVATEVVTEVATEVTNANRGSPVAS